MDNNAHTTYWILWLLAATLLAINTYHPLHLTLLFLVLFTVSVSSTQKTKQYLAMGVFIGATPLLVNFLLVHHGTTILFTMPPSLPLIGGPLTQESLVFGFTTGLMLASIVVAFGVFSENVSPDALVRVFPGSLAQTATALAIGLHFIPAVSRDGHAILAAQRSRGLNVSTGPLHQRMQGYAAIILPIFSNSFERAHHLAESLESRGYTSRRSRYVTNRWAGYLAFGAPLSIAAICTAFVLSVAGQLSYWPYEATPLPSLNVGYVLASLMLLSPLGKKHD